MTETNVSHDHDNPFDTNATIATTIIETIAVTTEFFLRAGTNLKISVIIELANPRATVESEMFIVIIYCLRPLRMVEDFIHHYPRLRTEVLSGIDIAFLIGEWDTMLELKRQNSCSSLRTIDSKFIFEQDG